MMGKGDKRRPTAIDDRTFSSLWCRAMGHKMSDVREVCINCGTTAVEIEESGHQELVQAPARRRRKRTRSPAPDATK